MRETQYQQAAAEVLRNLDCGQTRQQTRPLSAITEDNVLFVNDLILSQEDKPQSQKTVKKWRVKPGFFDLLLYTESRRISG